MRFFLCSSDENVAAFMVSHFFIVGLRYLVLRVCAGTAGSGTPGKCARMRGNCGA
jgi:hypothetical protein